MQWYSADHKAAVSFGTGPVDLVEKESFDGDDNNNDGITAKKLVINQLNRSHANSTYMCLAGNNDNDLESSLRVSVMINMYRECYRIELVSRITRGKNPLTNGVVKYNKYAYVIRLVFHVDIG